MAQSGGVSAQSPRPQSVGYYSPPNGILLPGTVNSVCYGLLSQDFISNSTAKPSRGMGSLP
jgi:hypothetical protein